MVRMYFVLVHLCGMYSPTLPFLAPCVLLLNNLATSPVQRMVRLPARSLGHCNIRHQLPASHLFPDVLDRWQVLVQDLDEDPRRDGLRHWYSGDRSRVVSCFLVYLLAAHLNI